MGRSLLFIVLLLQFQNHLIAQNTNRLVLGETKSGFLALGEAISYQLQMQEKQFALLNVKQQGIDLIIETFQPDGTKIEAFDSPNGNDGHELILLDATQSGLHEIRVSPLEEDKKIKIGAYEITLVSVLPDLGLHLDNVFKTLDFRDHIPGWAVSIVNSKELLYNNAFGYSQVERKIPYTIKTVQNIASISKTFVGFSLMKLVEQKKLDIEMPVSEILPFKISNPYYPDLPITIRHLATHTSTINEQKFYPKAYVLLDKTALDKNGYHKYFLKELERAAKNERISLPDYLKAYLSVDGKQFRKKHFFKKKPGDDWYYSNVGAALAAYIVELVSGQPFKEYVTTNIIKPMGLESAAWLGEVKDKFVQTTQYDSKGNPLPDRTIITYPDGGIFMNTYDLSQYAMQFIRANLGQDGILKSASLKELMKVQHEQKQGKFKGRKDGFFWEYGKGDLMGHSGGDYGVSAFMYFDSKTNMGYTFTCNILPTESDYSYAESRSIKAVLERYINYFKQ